MRTYQYSQEKRSSRGLCKIDEQDITLAIMNLFLQAMAQENRGNPGKEKRYEQKRGNTLLKEFCSGYRRRVSCRETP